MKTASLLLCLVLMSCSTTKIEQSKIDSKVANESSVTDGKTLGQSVHDTINASKTLDDKQKGELNTLFIETRETMKGLNEKSFKLKSVLVKELLSGSENRKQIKLLKKDIKKVESERLKSTFAAFDKISKIVRKDADAQVYTDHLMNMDRLR